ncbi:MAG: EamA/RhaT family transporter, partial [Pseudomonadota bacterium]
MKSENTRAALLMVAAEICFVVNDTIMKGLSDDVPLFQAIFVRGLMATALMEGVSYATGQMNF